MAEVRHPRIISVTGAHSSVGKTTLASLLLSNLKKFGAIKFTRTSLYTSVTDDPNIIMQEDKDTAIMADAGAEKVVWIQSPPDGLKGALDIALGKMNGLQGIIVEGNSPADFLNPLLRIFIIGNDGQIKPSARAASEKADIIVINKIKGSTDNAVPASVLKEKKGVFTIDLISKTGEIEQLIAYITKSLGNCRIQDTNCSYIK